MRWFISWFTSCLLIHIHAMVFLAGDRKVTACAIKGSEMGHEVLQLVRWNYPRKKSRENSVMLGPNCDCTLATDTNSIAETTTRSKQIPGYMTSKMELVNQPFEFVGPLLAKLIEVLEVYIYIYIIHMNNYIFFCGLHRIKPIKPWCHDSLTSDTDLLWLLCGFI